MLSLIIELSISKPTKEGNLKTFWICIILLNALWVFSYSRRETALNELFTGEKNRWVFNRGKKRNWQIYNYFSISTLFLSSPLSAAFSLDSPTYPLKVILFSALLSHVQSRLNGNLLGFSSSGKARRLGSRSSGTEILGILRGFGPPQEQQILKMYVYRKTAPISNTKTIHVNIIQKDWFKKSTEYS